MTPVEREEIYETLARRIDDFDADTAQVFLAKLALLMAHRIGDAAVVKACIADAAREIDP